MERLLLECSIRALLIASGTAVILLLLRVKTAAARHAAWTGVLVSMLILPGWLTSGPKAAVPVLPASSELAKVTTPEFMPPAPVKISEISAPAAPRVWTWNGILLGVYLLGAGALLLRLVIGMIRAKRLTGSACVAPVTIGLLRPRIILPEGSKEWPKAQLDAVLTHERAHVQRRDPLVQWLALFNRAIFWFHPLAWWLERKLAALAEEACDNVVLERGHDADEYAECLLAMERMVRRAGARVVVLGMAMPGSALPQRVKEIFDEIRARRTSRWRIVCAAIACTTTAALFAAGTLDHVRQPVFVAQARAQVPATVTPGENPKFEVAAIRPAGTLGPPQLPVPGAPGMMAVGLIVGGPGSPDPERLTARSATLRNVILRAYGLRGFQLAGPDALDTRWDINAKVPDGATSEQFNLMLRNLLQERFHLKIRIEQKDVNAYKLVVAKGGLKLKDSIDTARQSTQIGIANGANRDENSGFGSAPLPTGGRIMQGRAVRMSELVGGLQNWTDGVPVIDMTGLTGVYDFRFQFEPAGSANQDSPFPIIFTALEETLGLKLESTKTPLDFAVVDHVDSVPTGN